MLNRSGILRHAISGKSLLNLPSVPPMVQSVGVGRGYRTDDILTEKNANSFTIWSGVRRGCYPQEKLI